jgi:glycine oxidase
MPATNATVDVCVVGDGLVGLSIAVHLARAGRSVAVLGKDLPGRASTAAVGMLTPACEYDPWMRREFLDLLRAGRDYYPQFLDHAGVGAHVTYDARDFTLLDLHERTEQLNSRMGYLDELGFDCTWLDPWEVCEREPNLTPTAFRGGIQVRGDAVVNPVELWEALRRAVTAAGVTIDDSGLDGVEDVGHGVILRTGRARVLAERVVVAAGAWSTEVAGLAGLDVPLCPVKGQVVQLRGEPGLVRSVIFMPSGGCGSIVERSPGLYVVGTSEEYLEPRSSNSAGVVGAILHRLTTVLPEAAVWEVDRMWSGFRPMTGDELPIVGVADDPRFIVATGHHRNGVLLAPVTGQIVADLVDGGDGRSVADIDLTPFAYGRHQRLQPRFADKY